MTQRITQIQARDLFQEYFGAPPTVVASAPGRVNLIGEHTDYNLGLVLPIAIERRTFVAVGPSGDDQLHLVAADLDRRCTLPLDADARQQEEPWADYVLGVIYEWRTLGHTVEGLNLLITGDVPVGWSVLKLGNISRFKGGAGFPDTYQGQTDNEIPFFKVGDMVNADDARVMRKANHTITEATAKELRAFIFPDSTIVFAKVGAALLLKRYRLLGQSSCIDNNMMGMTVGRGSGDGDVASGGRGSGGGGGGGGGGRRWWWRVKMVKGWWVGRKTQFIKVSTRIH